MTTTGVEFFAIFRVDETSCILFLFVKPVCLLPSSVVEKLDWMKKGDVQNYNHLWIWQRILLPRLSLKYPVSEALYVFQRRHCIFGFRATRHPTDRQYNVANQPGIFALKHKSRKIAYCRDVEKSSRSFSIQYCQAAADRRPNRPGTKNKHLKLSNNPEICNLSTLVL